MPLTLSFCTQVEQGVSQLQGTERELERGARAGGLQSGRSRISRAHMPPHAHVQIKKYTNRECKPHVLVQ